MGEKIEEPTEKDRHPTLKFLERTNKMTQHKDIKRPTPRHVIVKKTEHQ